MIIIRFIIELDHFLGGFMKKIIVLLMCIFMLLSAGSYRAKAETASVSEAPAVRIAGKNRYYTSIDTADYLKEMNGGKLFESVVLTTGESFADALAGSYLANVYDAPILLINKKRAADITAYVNENLADNGQIFVLGGELAVPDEWIEGLKKEPKRLEGKNRYVTNLEILKQGGFRGGDLLVCVGKSEKKDNDGNYVLDKDGKRIDTAYADSLSASAVGKPILLVNKDKGLDDLQRQYLKSVQDPIRFYIIGGTSAIPETIEASLDQYGEVVKRVSGGNRYETSVAIAEEFFAEPDTVVLAYGENFPDGLSGGPLAYKLNAPLILTRTDNQKRQKVAEEYIDSKEISKGFIMGGNTLISDVGTASILNVVESDIETYKEEKPAEETYDIKVWIPENTADLVKRQIERFNQDHGNMFNVTVETFGEAEAVSKLATDPESGADLFLLTQDSIQRLVKGGLLQAPSDTAAQRIYTQECDAGSRMAEYKGTVYAYPVTVDNGYMLYYDKSVIPEEDIGDLDKILKDCELAGRTFEMEYQSSAWYAASFFFGTGCVSEWEVNANGEFTGLNDTFNSDRGLIALKQIVKLIKSDAAVPGSSAIAFSNTAAAVVSGVWDYDTAYDALGDNLGIAELPCFTADGNMYHLISFYGGKLYGVKTQTDENRAAALEELALYLSDKECQKELRSELQYGVSNRELQRSEDRPEIKALQIELIHKNGTAN